MNILVFDAPDATFKKVAQEEIEKFLKKHSLNSQIAVSVFFVSPAKIKELNGKYRKIDQSTDVLSFPVWKEKSEIPTEGEVSLGDIFICLSELAKNAQEKKIENTEELAFLVDHGLCHLIGKHH